MAAKKAPDDTITCKFKKTFVSSRGQAISGAKGEVKTFPKSDQLLDLLNDGTLEAVKGNVKETATKEADEAS